MREEGLCARRRRRFRGSTTDSEHAQPIAANVLGRQFRVETVAGVDRVWVGDITYLPTQQGWLYLAVILDLCSRLVVRLGGERAHQVAGFGIALAGRRLDPDPVGLALSRNGDGSVHGRQIAIAATACHPCPCHHAAPRFQRQLRQRHAARLEEATHPADGLRGFRTQLLVVYVQEPLRTQGAGVALYRLLYVPDLFDDLLLWREPCQTVGVGGPSTILVSTTACRFRSRQFSGAWSRKAFMCSGSVRT